MLRADDLAVAFSDATLALGTLHLPESSRVCVTGGSGSGKTTLLHVLSGIVRPSRGRVRHGEVDLFALSEPQRDRFRAEHLGYVFQTAQLLQGLSALENVALAASLGGRKRADARRRASALLKRVELTHRSHARPGELSVGEQQRVGIARALACEPALVLADEPTASLDERRSGEVLDLLDEVVAEAGASLVLVTHEPSVRDRFELVLCLDDGPLSHREEPA